MINITFSVDLKFLIVSNKRQTEKPTAHNFCCGNSHDPRKGSGTIKIEQFCLEKTSNISNF